MCLIARWHISSIVQIFRKSKIKYVYNINLHFFTSSSFYLIKFAAKKVEQIIEKLNKNKITYLTI